MAIIQITGTITLTTKIGTGQTIGQVPITTKAQVEVIPVHRLWDKMKATA